MWNSLPNNVVNAPSVNAFKNRLDKYWKSDPDKYSPECLKQQPYAPPRLVLQNPERRTDSEEDYNDEST